MHFSQGSANSSEVGRFRKCFVSFSALCSHGFFGDSWNGNMDWFYGWTAFEFVIQIFFFWGGGGLPREVHAHLNVTEPIILGGEFRLIKTNPIIILWLWQSE